MEVRPAEVKTEGRGVEGAEARREREFRAAVRQAAESVKADGDGSLWLQRLLLTKHVEKVQEKMLSWINEIDKLIEGMSNGWRKKGKKLKRAKIEGHGCYLAIFINS